MSRLAALACVERQTIRKAERGVGSPRAATKVLIAAVLDPDGREPNLWAITERAPFDKTRAARDAS